MKANKSRDYFTSALFLLPNLIGFACFTLGPVLASLILSFTKWDIVGEAEFVGLSNFTNLLSLVRTAEGWKANDPQFWYYLWNTFFFMLFIPLSMALSLVVAMLFNRRTPGVVVFRAIYFLPTVCSGVAVAILWRWLYAEFGVINYLLSQIGINGPPWLASIHWAKPAIAIMGLWIGLGGYNTILYLAALQDVPAELHHAAAIDGANGWRRFCNVTWPCISPTTFFIFIMSVIAGFQGGFMQAYLMTRGGPAGATTTLNYYVYNNAYEWFRMGYASAIAWVLFVIVFIITLINWRFAGTKVQYI